MSRFAGKVVLITGGASGLGKATALRVAQEGAAVALVDLSEDALAAAKADVLAAVPEAQLLTVTADVSSEEQTAAYVAATVDTFGRIDGFFNNAGVEGKQNPTAAYGSEEFARVLGINLSGVFYGLKHVLAVMAEQGSGAVVNMASVGGIRGVGNQAGYAASKHGVVGLTRNAAIEYGAQGITINAVAPGAILTPMVEGSLKQMDPENWEEVGKQFVSVNPSQRFGRPAEVAAVVAFLLSGEAGFVNAAVIPIDGGQSAKY